MKGGDPVSGLQKAVCLFLSVCFVAVLVITPGPFWPGENIYRQFPLYCFLEDSALGQQQKDQETYQLLMENNGEYLGKEIRKENQNKDQNKDHTVDEPVETPNPTEPTEAPTETPNPTEPAEEPTETPNPTEPTKKPAEMSESTEKPKKDHKEVASVSADIKPAPVLDLSPEILADQDYLMNHFFIVDEGTTADAVQLNAASFLREDFSLKKDQNVPQILIYHSHSQEAFADSREGMEEDTILGVGDYLTEILTEQYEYQVLHVREAFDMKSGELDRSKAYDYAREYLEPVLAENENIQVVIDLHRDGVPEQKLTESLQPRSFFIMGSAIPTKAAVLSICPIHTYRTIWLFLFSWNTKQQSIIRIFTEEFIWQGIVTIFICVQDPFFLRQEHRPIQSRK